MQQLRAYWTRATAWLGRQSQTAQLGLVIVALLVFFGGCGLGALVTRTDHGAGSGSTPRLGGTGQWVTVQHITGNENQQTATLTFPAGARIVWSVQPGPISTGNFLLDVVFSDGTSSLIANALTPPAAHSVYNLQHIPPGGSISGYLHIESDGNPYDIQIEVQQ